MENTRTNADLARLARISPSHLSLILAGKKKPSWIVAKRLATITQTYPACWADGEDWYCREAVKRWRAGQ